MTTGNQGEGIPATYESIVAAKMAYDKAKQAMEDAQLAITMERAKAFKLYGNLFFDEARQLGIKSSRPKQLNVHGRTSVESLMMKLLPILGTPSWSASCSTYSRCSDMMQAKPSSTTLRTH